MEARVDVEVAGRRYGLAQPMEDKFGQPVPEDLQGIGLDLRSRSALLRLPPDGPGVSRGTIAEAYGHDLALLERRREEFASWTLAAIRSSLQAVTSGTEPTPDIGPAWAELERQVPPIGRLSPPALPYERAAGDPATLLADLQVEIASAISGLVRLFTFWLHRLVETELLGLVEWAADAADVCRYHFIRHEVAEEITEERTRTERERGWLGGTVATFLDRTIRSQVFRVRLVHHLVNARLLRPEEYRRRIPVRVQPLLREAPLWVRPYLVVVEGQLTREEIVRRLVGEETRTETRVLAVYRYDPAIALGPFILAGWDADETEPARERRGLFRAGA